MKKLTFAELTRQAESKLWKKAVIVFSQEGFKQDYSLEALSYEISIDNKYFRPECISCSLFGSALDGTDNGVKLSEYMAEISGGADGWKVEYCYILN